MPYNRPKTYKVDVSESDKKTLEKLTKRHKLDQKAIVGYLINICDKYDLIKGDWEARLKAEDDKRRLDVRQQGSCPALIEVEKYYVCLWGQDGKPPKSKRLSRDIDEALEACGACEKTLEIKLENESYQARIKDLEMQIQAKADQKFKVPTCQLGSNLNDVGDQFRNCPKNNGKPVSISHYCKRKEGGKGCFMYKEILIAVGSNKS